MSLPPLVYLPTAVASPHPSCSAPCANPTTSTFSSKEGLSVKIAGLTRKSL